jgi:hypothetical protein
MSDMSRSTAAGPDSDTDWPGPGRSGVEVASTVTLTRAGETCRIWTRHTLTS